MKVYHVEVSSNGWRYSAAAGDIDAGTLDGILAVKRFGNFEDDWEMNISCTVVI